MKNARKMRGVTAGTVVTVITGLIFGYLICAMIYCSIYDVAYPKGYRQGQIDALSGHPAYTLATQPDGEVRWIERGK